MMSVTDPLDTLHMAISTKSNIMPMTSSPLHLHRSSLKWVSAAVHVYSKQKGHANVDRQRVVVFWEV